jgi:quercetin dioxygenase-like cupin family protein
MKFIKKIKEQEILKQAELLPILENQIVSTKLSDNDLFTFEMFSFSKGQSITSSKTLDPTLYYVTKGSIQISNDLLNKGDAIYKSVGSLQGLVAIEDTLIFSLVLKNELKIDNFESDKVINLEEYTKFVPNSVSSNTLIQSKSLSVTLFSLDTDEGLSTHAASGDAMVLALDGEVDIHIADQPFDVHKDELLILPYGIPHSLKAIKPFKMLLIVISI